MNEISSAKAKDEIFAYWPRLKRMFCDDRIYFLSERWHIVEYDELSRLAKAHAAFWQQNKESDFVIRDGMPVTVVKEEWDCDSSVRRLIGRVRDEYLFRDDTSYDAAIWCVQGFLDFDFDGPMKVANHCQCLSYTDKGLYLIESLTGKIARPDSQRDKVFFVFNGC